MLNIVIWTIIILLFIASFAGMIFPIIPSPFVLWLGFSLYSIMISMDSLSVIFWIAMALLTIILIVSDMIANSYFVRSEERRVGKECICGCRWYDCRYIVIVR